ncbi:MAG: hypothetical protein AVDCRST_MAG70-1177, partial [uncultured Thermomicrobiales bacterium]
MAEGIALAGYRFTTYRGTARSAETLPSLPDRVTIASTA